MENNKHLGIYVEVNGVNTLENALKKFKRKIKNSNIMMDYYDSQFFKKPSEKKREKKRKAISRNKYKVEEEKLWEKS